MIYFSAISFVANKLVYRFKIHNNVDFLFNLPPEDLSVLRLINHKEAEVVISFRIALAKIIYNKKYKPMNLKVGVFKYLRLY